MKPAPLQLAPRCSLRWSILLSGLTAAAQSLATPLLVDPWTDEAWQPVVLGLKPGTVRELRWTERLFSPRGTDTVLVSLRNRRLQFGTQGRLETLTVDDTRGGEPLPAQHLRYRYDAAGRLDHIEQEGVTGPLLQRHYDEAGRLVEELEHTGAALRRTRLRYDAQGHEIERTDGNGNGEVLVQIAREFRPDGSLARLEQRGTSLALQTVEFDAAGRPIRKLERDGPMRQITTIRYPQALMAEYDVQGVSANRGQIERIRRQIVYQVRRPEEFAQASAPLQPTLKRVVDGSAPYEIQTDFDAQGRPLAQRHVNPDGSLVCASRWQWHGSGLPSAIRTGHERREVPCQLNNGDIEIDVGTNERGHWTRQVMERASPGAIPGAPRQRLGVQTREIDYQ